MSKLWKTKTLLSALALSVLVLVLATGSMADRTVPGQESPIPGTCRTVFTTAAGQIAVLIRNMDMKIARGELKLAAKEIEKSGGFQHERYDLRYKSLPVWGAQILRHSRNGIVYLIDGDTLPADLALDIKPVLIPARAAAAAKAGLSNPEYKLQKKPELLVFPSGSGYNLAYKVTHIKFASQMASFVEAKTGKVLFRMEEIKTSSSIGRGVGTLGDIKKMSTEYQDSTYYAIDNMRPARIITGTSRHSTDTSTTYYVTDSDNDWTSDGTVADGHAYLGWIYDYYYLVHGRKGMDDANRQLVLTVHIGTNYENAFFSPSSKWMYFGDGNPDTNYPYTTALDIVAHEYTHGVTDATSNLNYIFESGALNEAFSDIMGVSCEFFHQPAGNGYGKAEWWEGEDIEKTFKPGRSLANPSAVPLWAGSTYYYPDHYSKRYILPGTEDGDYGGVHINSTIPSHWYYLLANGGTNRTSGISVIGIGLSKAEKIAYRTWTHYLRPASNFAGARNLSLQAATDLYGAGSMEYQTVARAWTAIGVN